MIDKPVNGVEQPRLDGVGAPPVGMAEAALQHHLEQLLKHAEAAHELIDEYGRAIVTDDSAMLDLLEMITDSLDDTDGQLS